MFMFLIAMITPSVAEEYAWMSSFNARAYVDLRDFRARRLSARFNVGEAQISAVMDTIKEPADIYMAFRLGEMSHQPVERMVDVYKTIREKGGVSSPKTWGLNRDLPNSMP